MKRIKVIAALIFAMIVVGACTVVYAPMKIVALTFDDGPSPEYTARVLDILKTKGVKATFFVLGKNAIQHPELVRRAVDEGHMIGNHSYSNKPFSDWDDSQVLNEILGTQQIVHQITGHSPLFVRNPYGIESTGAQKAVRMLGLTGTVGWHWVSEPDDSDWQCVGYQNALDYAKSATVPGAILVARDGVEDERCPNQLDWLSDYIDWVQSHGYTFGLLRSASSPDATNMHSWINVVPADQAIYWNE